MRATPSWDELFFNLAEKYRDKSKDPSSQFAAIAVDDGNIPVAFGFNGFPKKVHDTPERYNDREVKYRFVVHAEANMVALASKSGKSIDNCRLYIDTYPCSTCCGILLQAGIKEIVLNGDSAKHKDMAFQERWKADIDVTKIMCEEAGVKIRVYHKNGGALDGTE
jgi:dCMP deaminase